MVSLVTGVVITLRPLDSTLTWSSDGCWVERFLRNFSFSSFSLAARLFPEVFLGVLHRLFLEIPLHCWFCGQFLSTCGQTISFKSEICFCLHCCGLQCGSSNSSLQTSRVHPLLDLRTLNMNQFLSLSIQKEPIVHIFKGSINIHTHTFAIRHLRHLEFCLPQSLSLPSKILNSWFYPPKFWIQDFRPPKSWIQDFATLTPCYNSMKVTLIGAVPMFTNHMTDTKWYNLTAISFLQTVLIARRQFTWNSSV